jgi:hypothetical protein
MDEISRHYKFVQVHRTYNTKSEPDVHYTVMNACCAWDADSGRGYAYMGVGRINGKFLHFPLDFASNLKLL